MLSSGHALGPYRIDHLLGVGGMGEVYRATDTRLNRTVALKVLPPALAADPQFRARFEREAQVIASLSHAHICTLHDVGHHDQTDFLVLEFLEGETLASRLERGAPPLEQAIAIAIQIAEALDAAHGRGIVHRDLKPGNVMLTKGPSARQGAPQVKLLDFGLAKPAAPAIAASGLSMLPTTPPAENRGPLTAQGAILGTFQYMAPEQVEGHEADARTDIFAFGAVVYELLTGRKAFEGKTQASLIGAIMHASPPPVSTAQPLAPGLLDRVVNKCLAKNPDDRWQSARDVASELGWIAESLTRADAPTVAPSGASFTVARVLPWALAALVAIVSAAALMRRPAVVTVSGGGPVVRATLLPPKDVALTGANPPDRLALSPDGRYLAFVGFGLDRVRHLWLRPLDGSVAELLPGTENAMSPFWSPDNREIAFFAAGRLKRIGISGGPPITICALPGIADGDTNNFVAGGTWNKDGTILFSVRSDLYRVGVDKKPASMGEAELPFFLPDGNHFLYRVSGAPIHIGVGRLDSAERQVVLEGDVTQAMFANGFLLFVRDQTLLAQSFDPARLSLEGDVHLIASSVTTGTGIRSAFTVSQAGIIAYQSFVGGELSQLQWIDRGGKLGGVLGEPGVYGNVALSPDGTRIVTSIPENVMGDLWLLDVSRTRPPTRLTRTPENEEYAAWSPRSDRLAYVAAGPTGNQLFLRSANAAGAAAERLAAPPPVTILDWSADERFVLLGLGAGVSLLEVAGDGKPSSLNLPAGSGLAQFSPNGRWIAYQSRESGQSEIYVIPAPGQRGDKVALSVQGGWPRWSRDGNQLFFLSGANLDLMAAEVRVQGDVLSAGVPKLVFQTRLKNVIAGWPYDVARDGRFLMNVRADAEIAPPAMVVSNWPALISKN